MDPESLFELVLMFIGLILLFFGPLGGIYLLVKRRKIEEKMEGVVIFIMGLLIGAVLVFA